MPLLQQATPTMREVFSIKNLRTRIGKVKGGSPVQMLAQLALGEVITNLSSAVEKPAGEAFRRTLDNLLPGGQARARTRRPTDYGLHGPDITVEIAMRMREEAIAQREMARRSEQFALSDAMIATHMIPLGAPIVIQQMVPMPTAVPINTGGGGGVPSAPTAITKRSN